MFTFCEVRSPEAGETFQDPPRGVPLTLLINTGKPVAFVANLSREDRYYTAIYYIP